MIMKHMSFKVAFKDKTIKFLQNCININLCSNKRNALKMTSTLFLINNKINKRVLF